MTRVIIFGDLHANWEALLALQRAEHARMWCFAWATWWAMAQIPSVAWTPSGPAQHTLGGHDLAVGRNAAVRRLGGGEVLEASWAHTRSLLSAGDRDYLASLPPN